MQDEIKAIENIAIICKSVIEDPETHIDSLALLQQSFDYRDWNYRSVLFLSLTKVYKNITPLYKIRGMKDKVKFGEDEDFITEFDKKMLKEYNFFIKKLLEFDNKLTYECASILFSSLFYFNNSEKLIYKILKGSLNQETDFSDVLYKILSKDKEGVVSELITNKMIDLQFKPGLLSLFLEINLQEEGFKKTYDNIFRIYFTVLKEKKKEFLYFTYKGLQKFKEKIEKKYMEGLYILLTDLLLKGNVSSRLECVNCILTIFGEKEYDFKKILNSLYEIITPLKYYIKSEESILLCDLLRKMFILRRQNEMRIRKILHRLMQYSLLKYNKDIILLIYELKMSYSINFNKKEEIFDKYDYLSEDIDDLNDRNFLEYSLFKHMVRE